MQITHSILDLNQRWTIFCFRTNTCMMWKNWPCCHWCIMLINLLILCIYGTNLVYEVNATYHYFHMCCVTTVFCMWICVCKYAWIKIYFTSYKKRRTTSYKNNCKLQEWDRHYTDLTTVVDLIKFWNFLHPVFIFFFVKMYNKYIFTIF